MEPWQRAQYLVILTVAMSHVGFDLTQPFIPLYVRQLGVTDLGEAAFWSGLTVGISPLGGALLGPLWGMLADRFGRKLMVLRSLVMMSILHFALAFVPDVGWLFGLRFAVGLVAGFGPMSMALAVSLGPREHMGRAIGLIQAAQFLPLAIGPPIGGLISDAFGLRANFILTGVLLIPPALLLFFLVQENVYDAPPDRPAGKAGARGSLLGALLLPGFAAVLGVTFMGRFTDRALPPILPLYLVELETPSAQLATVTGLVVSAGAVAATVSSMLFGRLARPGNTRRLLLLSLAGGAACSAPLALTTGWPQVLGLRLLLGLLAGGTLSLAYTLGARLAPPERSAFTLSVVASGGQLGGALAPVSAGLLGQFSLRAVFLANAVAYLIALALTLLILRAGGLVVRPGYEERQREGEQVGHGVGQEDGPQAELAEQAGRHRREGAAELAAAGHDAQGEGRALGRG
ncbi:MAG TPA: MFS transporter, partial [Actinomycetes bacterium]|nr:MFS transporter [Actinomycetes bacterium]